MRKLLAAALAILLLAGAGTTASADTQKEVSSYSIQMMSDGGPPM